MAQKMKKPTPEKFLQSFKSQEEARNFLWQVYRTGRIASTYLFAGPAGVGKFLAGLEFAKFLKCKNKIDDAPCDRCKTCRTMQIWDNPDLFIIFPMPLSVWESDEQAKAFEEFRKSPYLRPSFNKPAGILLPMIHEIQRFLSTSATEDGGKFVFVPDVHMLNQQAANAFLKILEEPPPDTHIILSTDRAEALLPTIRSRAQQVRFRRLPTDEVRRQLEEQYLFPPENASLIAALSEGSIAIALKVASNEFQETRMQAIELIRCGAEKKLPELWDWASSAPGELDYAQSLIASTISLARDIVVGKSDGKILNMDAKDTVYMAAQAIESPFKALEMMRELTNLQSDLARNPQYSLFYAALAAIIYRGFLN